MTRIRNIAVIGDGGWGTTLAIYLFQKECNVTLWGAFEKNIKELKKTRENRKFLKGRRIPKGITFTHQLSKALLEADLIVFAVPSKYTPSVLKKLKKFDLSHKYFLSVVKGLDTNSLQRMSQVIRNHLGSISLAVLSGPTIAREVAMGMPSAAVIASRSRSLRQKLQNLFHSKTFRIYTNSDIIGVELGGSMKNVIALAVGICDGLGLGSNTKAAIMTRGLAEMTRIGRHMGAKTKTLFGLAGLGDLSTTCMSLHSRNRFVGEQLGKGKKWKAVSAKMEMVAEGVPTAKALYRYCKRNGISAPITTEIYRVIYLNKEPIKAVVDLMTRRLKSE